MREVANSFKSRGGLALAEMSHVPLNRSPTSPGDSGYRYSPRSVNRRRRSKISEMALSSYGCPLGRVWASTRRWKGGELSAPRRRSRLLTTGPCGKGAGGRNASVTGTRNAATPCVCAKAAGASTTAALSANRSKWTSVGSASTSADMCLRDWKEGRHREYCLTIRQRGRGEDDE